MLWQVLLLRRGKRWHLLRFGCDGKQQAAKKTRQSSQIHPSRVVFSLNRESTAASPASSGAAHYPDKAHRV